MENIRLKVLFAALSSISAVVFADVSLYGKVAVGLENDQFHNNTIPDGGSVQDYGSYFGIRGTDPVYGETAIIWQVEQYLDIAAGQSYYSTTGGGMIVPHPSDPTNFGGYMKNNTNTLASSETYLGLQGSWGRIMMGNLSNYQRSNMGNTNMFNCANGANCLLSFTRTLRLVQTSIRYDTPTVEGFNASFLYGLDTNGRPNMTGVSAGNNYGAGLNGVYSGGIMAGGIGYTIGDWQINLGAMVWQQVGNYSTGASDSTTGTGNPYQSSTYDYAYSNTLEVGYNDPDGLIANAGFQITNGMAWNSWAVSGGTLGVGVNGVNGNPRLSPYYDAAVMLNNNAKLQTQEVAVSLGYHLGPWTPKIGYAYGNNMMVGGNPYDLVTGTAQQIPNSGYQNVAAELDWNITPRTIAFIGYGQVWYGSTLQNVTFGPQNTSQGGPSGVYDTTVNGDNQYLANQSSYAIGFSHTF